MADQGAGQRRQYKTGKVAPGDITQRVGVEAIAARSVNVEQFVEKLIDAAGFALLCTAKPRSDLRLCPGAKEAMRAHRLAHRLPVPRGT
jgi:hypothetical protein